MQNIYTPNTNSNIVGRYDEVIEIFENRLEKEKQKEKQEPKRDEMFIPQEYTLTYTRMLDILKRRREIVTLLDKHSLLEKCKSITDFANIFDEKSIDRNEIDVLYKAYNLNLLTINCVISIDLAKFLDTFNRNYILIYEQLNNVNDEERKNLAYENVISRTKDINESHTAFNKIEKMKNLYIGLVAGNAQDRSEFAKEIFRVIPKIIYQDLYFY